jgi:hypothetical protein
MNEFMSATSQSLTVGGQRLESCNAPTGDIAVSISLPGDRLHAKITGCKYAMLHQKMHPLPA